jgi:hypothetical protein
VRDTDEMVGRAKEGDDFRRSGEQGDDAHVAGKRESEVCTDISREHGLSLVASCNRDETICVTTFS